LCLDECLKFGSSGISGETLFIVSKEYKRSTGRVLEEYRKWIGAFLNLIFSFEP
jgi:hypothetical protein